MSKIGVGITGVAWVLEHQRLTLLCSSSEKFRATPSKQADNRAKSEPRGASLVIYELVDGT